MSNPILDRLNEAAEAYIEATFKLDLVLAEMTAREKPHQEALRAIKAEYQARTYALAQTQDNARFQMENAAVVAEEHGIFGGKRRFLFDFGGYVEVQTPKRKVVIADKDALIQAASKNPIIRALVSVKLDQRKADAALADVEDLEQFGLGAQTVQTVKFSMPKEER